MAKLIVSILWHQHQPYYVDPIRRSTFMPWVRLHAVKDYYGMAQLVREQPKVRLTVNLVPSLLKQIHELVAGEVKDELFEICRKPVDALADADAVRVVDECFMLNWSTMVNPYPRYRELLTRRDFGRKSPERARKQFAARDLLDLMVWNNLSWIHPWVIEQDERLAALKNKGRDFTEPDKHYVLEKHLELMRAVIPLHRQMQESGQIELCTSPFYHPILPLLCDITAAREARPGTPLPDAAYHYPEDATAQVQRAVRDYRELFGVNPRGMWPSEGSVSRAIIPVLSSAEIKWMATDEGILEASLGEPLARDSAETLMNPSRLYRPYRVSEAGQSIAIVFRDRYLSDLIGFKYQWVGADEAVNDLIQRLHRVARHDSRQPFLVSIILDGENAWEHYPNSGADFLRLLYRRLAEDSTIEMLPISEAIAAAGEASPLDHLKPGSWINRDFNTWVGHREKNQAWEYLARTRSFLKGKEESGTVTDPQVLAQAWEELYVAEGSDWFWWYGDDHSSGQDDQFDRLFRLHLQSIYRALGEKPPDFLNNAICQVQLRELFTEPRSFLRVTYDGRRSSYFEWVAAGHYDTEKDRGAMHRSTERPVQHVYFGFDADHFFLRLDPEEDKWGENAAELSIRVRFNLKTPVQIQIARLDTDVPTLRLVRGEGPDEEAELLESIASDQIVELGCPFAKLGLKEGDEAPFAVIVYRNEQVVQRAPENTIITLRVPSGNFEQIMWRV